MLRSMYTAISSLNIHQTYLDVISDNLANANTTGFKASRVVFQDQMAQIMSTGAAATADSGGINPTQIGLGAKLGSITMNFAQGTLQSTGNNSDLAIQGDGFFIYDEGADRRYSREGSLDVDADGYLVNSNTGLKIQGWQLEAGSTETIDTNQQIGTIHVDLNSTLARATSTVSLGGNLSSDTEIGKTVDTTVGIYDSLGALQTVSIQFTRDDDTTWTWAIVDEDGNVVTRPDDTEETGTITFDADGQYTSANPAAPSFIIPASNGASTTDVAALDITSLTQLSDTSSVTATSQDGLAAGTVSDLYASPNSGEVYVLYSNGLKQLVGQLALATFSNPEGLLRDGDNLFQEGLNSGEPQIGVANSGSRGSIMSGYLEGSNVDMAQEFTNMIMAQRGFQASSRVITTSDEILDELVNLKR